MTDNQYTKSFTSYLKIEEGKSDKTITAYLNDINRFRNYLGLTHIKSSEWMGV